MKKELVFALAAEQDLNEIWEYIARDNLSAAIRFTGEIEEKCQLLLNYPKIGRKRPEFALNLYSLPFKDYIIFYRPNQNGIQIVRVIHAARNILRLFE